MKLQAEIDGEKHEITIHRDGEIVRAEIDGRRLEASASQPEHDVFLIKTNGRIFQASVEKPPDEPGISRVQIGKQSFDISVIDPKRLRSSAGDGVHADGLAEIKTAMPGKVVRVVCSVGDEIEKGSSVLVVEAMKMQNELKAPKSGIVKEIRVAEGSTVSAGDILATIE